MTEADQLPWDLFISHASEDKDNLVRPLAVALDGLGVKVWFDEFSLQAGDSLIASIDRGIAGSRFGLLVLSARFLNKPFPEYERRGLTSRDVHGEGRLIPLWHGVERAQVAAFSPTLADRLAILSEGKAILDLALEVLKIVRPEQFDALERWKALLARLKTESRAELLPLNELHRGPILHDRLPSSVLSRLQLVHQIVHPYMPARLEDRVDDFRRDLRPQFELIYWECLCVVFLEQTVLDGDEREEVFTVLLASTFGPLSTPFLESLAKVTPDRAQALHERYLEVIARVLAG